MANKYFFPASGDISQEMLDECSINTDFSSIRYNLAGTSGVLECDDDPVPATCSGYPLYTHEEALVIVSASGVWWE